MMPQQQRDSDGQIRKVSSVQTSSSKPVKKRDGLVSSARPAKRHQQNDECAHSKRIKQQCDLTANGHKERNKKLARKSSATASVALLSQHDVVSRKASPSGIARLQAIDATAQRLWQEAVAARKPAIIEGHLQDSSWHASPKWTNAYLKSRAGTAKVLVERRTGATEGFGKGRKVHMTLSQLLDELHQGSNSLYLTTQEAELDSQGRPGLMGPPVSQLQQDFPMRPHCVGNLVPQSINMWMGAASEGASSGLHHDFHDNLYILLRGRKRFRLYPPTQAPNMYTNGKLKLIHPNGRIVYEGQGNVAADGSHPGSVRRWRQQAAAEKELEAAELAVKRKDKGAKANLAKAEQALELALEAWLTAGQSKKHDVACSSDSWPAGMQDDYVDSDAEVAADADSDDSSADDRQPVSQQKQHDTGNAETSQGNSRLTDVVDESHPDSFSRVDLSRPQQEIKTQFPLFPGTQAVECELEAGQMLYLPCGWFHEVRSYGHPDEGGHLALNYWFHPPDNIGSGASMDKPYTSQYWAALWAQQDSR